MVSTGKPLQYNSLETGESPFEVPLVGSPSPSPTPPILRMSKVTYIFGALLGASSLASAQVPDVFICDTAQDQLIRLTDIDGDGEYYGANEASRFYSDGTLGTASTQEQHGIIVRNEGGLTVAYWIDPKSTAVYRGTDGNLNGLIDAGEETLFRDTATLDDPNADFYEGGLAFASDGAIWYTTNWNSFTPHTGVYRLMDLNADGDAADAGELQKMAEVGNGLTTPNAGGPVTIDMAEFSRISGYQVGVVGWTGSDSFGTDFSLYSFQDVNSDGDVMDAGEAFNFMNPSGKNPLLDQNVDFATGVLRNQETWDHATFPPVQNSYNRFRYVATLKEGGKDIIYCASDASDSSAYSQNEAGDGLNGLIYRCEDLNLDGDANDAGEVTLFFDGSFTSGFNAFPKIVGMASHGSSLYVAALTNDNVIWRLEDLNGDGDAMDANELDGGLTGLGLWDPNGWGGIHGDYPVPYDTAYMNYHVFCRQIGTGDNGLWVDPSQNFSTSGTGCSQYGTDIPTIHGLGKAQIGASTFVTEVRNVPAGMPAALVIGFDNTQWFGIPLPFDLAPLGWAGCTLYQDWQITKLTVTSGTGLTGGVASIALPVPADPTFIGVPVHLQWGLLNVNPFGFDLGLTGLGTIIIE
jgi:hypothetical protein